MSPPLGTKVVAGLMILLGLAEVVTAFRHRFFGIITAQSLVFSYAASAIGTVYAAAGLLTLTGKRVALWAAIFCLGLDVAGRIALAAAGLYPLNDVQQIVAMAAGTLLAAGFAIYLWSKRARFS